MTSHVATGAAATLGRNVRAARLGLGLTQHDLATRLGVRNLAVSRWELGKSRPYDIEGLASELGVDVAWLYTDHEED